MLVMWEMAVASAPSSPRLGPSKIKSETYGAMEMDNGSPSGATPLLSTGSSSPVRRDKFTEGRLWSYIPVLICSVICATAASLVMFRGESSEHHYRLIAILSHLLLTGSIKQHLHHHGGRYFGCIFPVLVRNIHRSVSSDADSAAS